jgi:competence protein ComEA
MHRLVVSGLICLSFLNVGNSPYALDTGPPKERINVNTAMQAELERLPGIGPAKAKEIINERKKEPFSTVDDLMRVKGIKKATLDQFRSLVKVNDNEQPYAPLLQDPQKNQEAKPVDKSKASKSKDDNEKADNGPPGWATLVGSTKSKPLKYHALGCSNVAEIKPENRIWFADANDAVTNGYVAAGCKNKACREKEKPNPNAKPGPVGGLGLQPPDPNPPQVPNQPAPPPNWVPPDRPPPDEEIWRNVSKTRELDARKQWDAWAKSVLAVWERRWHVTRKGGKAVIEKNVGYPEDVSQQLTRRHNEMQQQINENSKHIKELEKELTKKSTSKK